MVKQWLIGVIGINIAATVSQLKSMKLGSKGEGREESEDHSDHALNEDDDGGDVIMGLLCESFIKVK